MTLACAVCGARGTSEKTLKKCSVCKAVAYCSKECQKADWKNHKPVCRSINSTGDQQKSVARRIAAHAIPKTAECVICLEHDSKLILLGCACRGDSGYGHLACRIKAAKTKGVRDYRAWDTCPTCKQEYTGAMRMGLARSLVAETGSLRRDDDARLNAYHNLANTLKVSGQCGEAVRILREILAITKTKYGAKDRRTLCTAMSLANVHNQSGQLEEAIVIYRENLKLKKEVLGPKHANTLTTEMNLAIALKQSGQLKETIVIYRENLKLRKEVLGPKHADTLDTAYNLANALSESGQWEAAIEIYRENLKLKKELLGSKHPVTLTTAINLANALDESGQLEEAIGMYRENLKLRKEVLGASHPNTVLTAKNLSLAIEN